MNIKELKEFIKDLPDDMLVVHETDGCMYNEANASIYESHKSQQPNDIDYFVRSRQTVLIVSDRV